MREEVASELTGRLRDAEQASSFWLKRRFFDVEGVHEVFDAWVLVRIAEARLSRLYEEELRRSRQEVSKLGLRVRSSLDAMTEQQLDPMVLSKALRASGFARTGMRSLQDVDGLGDLQRDVERLDARVAEVLVLDLRLEDSPASPGKARVRVEARAGEKPLPGLRLRFRSECGGATTEQKEESTDATGGFSLSLDRRDPLAPCRVEVEPVDAKLQIRFEGGTFHSRTLIDAPVRGAGVRDEDILTGLSERVISLLKTDLAKLSGQR